MVVSTIEKSKVEEGPVGAMGTSLLKENVLGRGNRKCRDPLWGAGSGQACSRVLCFLLRGGRALRVDVIIALE